MGKKVQMNASDAGGTMTDMFSMEAIPLYEHEVVQAVEKLLNEEVDAITVSLWHSYMNPMHKGSES